jgi:RHS repeat-associated protein
MAVYKTSGTTNLTLEEQHIYGSSRLGIFKKDKNRSSNRRVLGERRYELTDHFGNVRVVLSDYKKAESIILSATDYYPFGMVARTYTSPEEYRYGFNGQERETELDESTTSAEYWMYDGRLGRRWNVDPVFKPWFSSYSVLSNNPILMVDPKGDDDYFDFNGNYLGSDNNEDKEAGNKIRIIDINTYKSIVGNNSDKLKIIDKEKIDKLVKDSYLLTTVKFEINKNTGEGTPVSNSIIEKIARYYDDEPDYVAYRVSRRQALASFIPEYYEIHIGINVQGRINELFYNKWNLKNTLYHENRHRHTAHLNKGIDQEFDYKGILIHLDVYFDQVNHYSFEHTTQDYKQFIFDKMTAYLERFKTMYDKAGKSKEYVKRLEKLNAIKTKYKLK